MRVAIAGLVLVIGSMAVAHGAESRRENAMRNMAELLAVARLCPAYRIDLPAFAHAGISHGIDAARGSADRARLEAMAKDIAGKIANHGDKACRVAFGLYGPYGTKVPGMLKLSGG